MNPCTINSGRPCERFRADEQWVHGRDCRLCWMYANDATFREYYDRPENNVPAVGSIKSAPLRTIAHSAPVEPPEPPPPPPRKEPCAWIGKVTDRNSRSCAKCWTYECELFERTVPSCGIKEGIHCCERCNKYLPQSAKPEGVPDEPAVVQVVTEEVIQSPPTPELVSKVRWAYGTTTHISRRNNLLPQTLASLKAAGFSEPRLFVDGDSDTNSWRKEFNLEVTTHYPTIRTFGNWILALEELYIRDPAAERYAIFQDDLIAVKNLKFYLEQSKVPDKSYLNLYSFPQNERLVPRIGQTGRSEKGWFKGVGLNSGPPHHQKGLGAVALVFTRQAVVTLLAAQHMWERPMDSNRGHKAVDGGIVTAMNKAGWTEYFHSPSLVQHTGLISSMRNKPHPQSDTFPGEAFDAMLLLETGVV